MKKLLLVAGIALFGFNANAQEAKQGLEGTWWVAGQVAFGSTDNGTTETKSSTILPIVGYFIAPTTTIGVGVGMINSKTEAGSTTTAETSAIVFKPLVRKYWNVAGNLYFYGQAALPVIIGDDKQNDVKSSSVSLELAPGFDYIVNKWLTIETSFTIFNTGFSSSKPDGGDKTSSFNFNANPMNSVSDRQVGNLQVGVKFLF
jgi:hypothetical protein